MTPAPAIQTLELLQALLYRPLDWRFGYELSQITGLRHGTIYPQLLRLEASGLLESRWEQHGGRRRHMYRLTDAGRSKAGTIMTECGWRLAGRPAQPPTLEAAAGS